MTFSACSEFEPLNTISNDASQIFALLRSLLHLAFRLTMRVRVMKLAFMQLATRDLGQLIHDVTS